MTALISMMAPSPGQIFTGLPSGATYRADNNGLIANIAAADVVEMILGGCQYQSIRAYLPTATLATLYLTDQVVIARNGVSYLAPISAVLAVSKPPSSGAQLNFSNPANSNLLAVGAA